MYLCLRLIFAGLWANSLTVYDYQGWFFLGSRQITTIPSDRDLCLCEILMNSLIFIVLYLALWRSMRP